MRLVMVRRGLLGALVLLVVLAFALAYLEMGAAESEAPPVPVSLPVTVNDSQDIESETDFFVEYRIERERSRGRQIELMQDITGDPNSGEEARAKAEARLLEISRDMDQEVSLENILRAQGYQDAVVFLQGDMVTVVVPGTLSPEQNTSIVNLVSRGAVVPTENIMVVSGVD